MSSAAEIRESSVGGLGLFTKRNLEPGDIVIVERPLVLVAGLEWEDMDAVLSDESPSSRQIQAGLTHTRTSPCFCAHRSSKVVHFYLIRGKLAAVEKLAAKEAEIFWSFTQAPGYGIRRTAQASGHHGSSSATLPVVDPCAAATGANHKRQPDLMLAMIIE